MSKGISHFMFKLYSKSQITVSKIVFAYLTCKKCLKNDNHSGKILRKWQFSPPFRFLKMEYLVTSQNTHPLPVKNITVYTLLSKDTLLFRSAICRKMLQIESNNQSLPGLGRIQTHHKFLSTFRTVSVRFTPSNS